MRQKFELKLLDSTVAGVKEHIETVLDPQIAEMEENLHLLKLARGTLARTFGLDRRDGSYVEQLVDGAKRAETEIDEGDLDRALSMARFGDPIEDLVTQVPAGTTVVVVDSLSKHMGAKK